MFLEERDIVQYQELCKTKLNKEVSKEVAYEELAKLVRFFQAITAYQEREINEKLQLQRDNT